MNVIAFEGIVDNGQIKLPADLHLPDQSKVFIVVPNAAPKPVAHIFSPRLAHPEQANDFVLEVIEEEAHA